MTDTIYAIGYSGRQPAEIKQLAEQLGATVFDVRLSPRSRNPVWTRKQLTELLGDHYLHVPAWGNLNYKGGPIAIADFDHGLTLLKESPRPVILMCVCSDPAVCHRTTLAARLADLGYTVTELNATRAASPQQLELL